MKLLREPVMLIAAVALTVGVAACGSSQSAASPPSSDPTAVVETAIVGPTSPGVSSVASPSSSSSQSPSASVSPSPATVAASFPLALVARNTDLRAGYTSAQVATLLASGRVIVPCGLSGLSVGGADVALPAATCSAAASIPAALATTKAGLALLPAGLVDPRVKVLTVDGADLFGDTVVRATTYPLIARSAALPADLVGVVGYDAADIRTLVSTGDTCPDRTVSYWANVKGKGWDWTLQGGAARYTAIVMDRSFSGPTGDGWPVVQAVRTGKNPGAVWRIIHDADVAVNDFECPMVADFTQHDHGTYFTIDPNVAGLFARAGMDVASLASNHITDLGAKGINQTVAFLEKAGVKHAGAGKDLAAAMAPAVVDVRGLRFAILSWDATNTSRAATATSPGALRPTTVNVRTAVAKARSVADVVIAMPQWNWPEYSAPFSKTALAQRDAWFAAGVDHILGSGTHWASAMSVTKPDPKRGWRAAVTSHGNFLFGQRWSRQTQEGLIYELAFVGTRLAQVRVHPYIVMDGAQPNLTAPTTDGAYVQRQVFAVSRLP